MANQDREVPVGKKLVFALIAFLSFLALVLVEEGISQVPDAKPVVVPDAPLPPAIPPLTSSPAPLPTIKTDGVEAKDEPKKLINIWTMQMEQVDGRNIVKATIGRKHEIRIECDVMDYQTQKGVFVAHGKVQLSGVSVQCRCDTLTINLNEDRLVLQGKAEVRTFKERKYEKEEEVGNPERVLLDLTGEHLSLRWPDLQIKSASAHLQAKEPQISEVIKIPDPTRKK
jgi:hypothetical protein